MASQACGILPAMPEESAARDPVELIRALFDAGNRRDLDDTMRIFAPDVVWESLDGLGVFAGAMAVRGFLEDWLSAYEVLNIELEQVIDLGSGVAFIVGRESGRLLGSGRLEQRVAWAIASEHGHIVRLIASVDIDKARLAAERLADKRRQTFEV
jgi:ketosteroid isomerase-like protein